MVVVARVLLRVFLVTAAVYGCLVAIATALAPRDTKPQTIDTASAPSTMYGTPTKYLMFMQPALRLAGRRVIVLGASNADIELRPDLLSQTIRCATVDNLSIGNANITELAQTAQLAFRNRQMSGPTSDVYVLGIWFGMFGDNRFRWYGPGRENHQSDIDVEYQRYGVYRKSGDIYESRLGPAYETVLNNLVSPLALFEKISRESTLRARRLFFTRPDSRTDEEREAAVVSEAEQKAAVEYWQRQLGSADSLSEAQFDQLAKTITLLSHDRNKVLVVDLPIPSWWNAAVPMAKAYKDRLAAMDKSFADNSAVKFMSFDQFDKPEYFSDEVHTKPSISKLIGQSVAKVVSADACNVDRQTHLLEGHR